MSPCDQLCFAGKPIHFHCKDHMALHPLISRRNLLCVIEDPKGNMDILHFLCIASRQRLVFVSLSISRARLTVLGISNPNLWVVLWYQQLTAARIISFFFVMYGTHQEKASSPSIPLCFQPVVVFRWCCLPLMVMYQSTLRTALESFWWSVIASSNRYWFPSGSHWAYICSAIAFAENSAVWPSMNSTSYSQVSRIGI